MGISGYCITMWIISTDAPPETAADPAHFSGLLLPSTLLHPSVVARHEPEGSEGGSSGNPGKETGGGEEAAKGGSGDQPAGRDEERDGRLNGICEKV